IVQEGFGRAQLINPMHSQPGGLITPQVIDLQIIRVFWPREVGFGFQDRPPGFLKKVRCQIVAKYVISLNESTDECHTCYTIRISKCDFLCYYAAHGVAYYVGEGNIQLIHHRYDIRCKLSRSETRIGGLDRKST